MKFQFSQVLTLARTAISAHKGRPLALTILLWLSLGNLVSEWPFQTKPGVVKSLEQFVAGPFQTGQRLVFDGYQRKDPRIPASQPVTIVAIDEASLAAIGQWPWPRNRMAELIDAINRMNPLAIGLDIYMPEPDQTSPDKVADNLPARAGQLARSLRELPSHETLLANALNRAPTILGAAGFDHEAMTTADHLQTVPLVMQGSDARVHVRKFDQVLASLPQLQSAAHGQAMLSVALEQGVVRRMPLVMSLGDKLVPGLTMEMLRMATDSTAIEVLSDPTGVKEVGVADVRVPTQRGGEIWLHFARQESTADRYVSALSILQGKADPERFENKLILLGLTGAGLNDMRTTALGELVPGIEIQAQAIETIIDGRMLQRPTWLKWAEVGFLLTFGLFLIWYVPRTESRLATFLRNVPRAAIPIGLALNMAIITAGYMVFKHYGLLVDAASIFIVTSGIMGSLVSSAMVEIERKNKAQLAAEQLRKQQEAYEAGVKAGLEGQATP